MKKSEEEKKLINDFKQRRIIEEVSKNDQSLGFDFVSVILLIVIVVCFVGAWSASASLSTNPSASVSLVPQELRNATRTSHPVFGAIKNHITEVQYDGHIYLVYQEGITHKANCTNPAHSKKGGAQ